MTNQETTNIDFIQEGTTIIHPLVCEWRCAFDELMKKPNLNNDRKVFQDFLKFRKMNSTSLSANVYNLLHLFNMERLMQLNCKFGENNLLVDEDGFLNFNCSAFNLSSLIIEGNVQEDGSNEFFNILAEQIQPIAMFLHENCFQLTNEMLEREKLKSDDFKNQIIQYRNQNNLVGAFSKWNKMTFFNHFKETFADFMCVAYPREITFKILEMVLEEHYSGNSLVGLSLLVPLLERGLQDSIYIDLVHKNDKQRVQQFEDFQKLPKFSELLTMNELKDIYGDEVALLLRCLVGPLNSINLRNVSLHGFINEREFQDCYLSLILLIIPSLSKLSIKHLNDTIGVDQALLKRQIIDLSNCKPVQEIFKVNNTIGRFLKINTNDGREIDELLEHSVFVLNDSIPLWKRAFIEYFENSNYYKTVSIIFPLFEHSIRRIFVCVNGCEDRLLTAEKNSLYTTLDVLFTTKPIPSYNIYRNGIFDVIGNNLLNAIFDLLIWVESPRVRDLISHGNINIDTIPQALVDEIMKLMLALIYKFDVRKYLDDYKIDSDFASQLNFCKDYFDSEYISPFHSMSILDRQLKLSFDSINLMESYENVPNDILNLPNFKEIRDEVTQQDPSHEKLLTLIPNINKKLEEYIEFVKSFYNIHESQMVKHLENHLHQVTFSDRAVKKANQLRCVVIYAEIVSQKTIEFVNEHYALANNTKKKLKSRDRTYISLAVSIFETFKLFSILFTYITYLQFYHSKDIEDTNVSRVCERLGGGIGTSIKSGKIVRGIELIACLLPNIDNVVSQIGYKFVGISKGEIDRYKCDLEQLIKSAP